MGKDRKLLKNYKEIVILEGGTWKEILEQPHDVRKLERKGKGIYYTVFQWMKQTMPH